MIDLNKTIKFEGLIGVKKFNLKIVRGTNIYIRMVGLFFDYSDYTRVHFYVTRVFNSMDKQFVPLCDEMYFLKYKNMYMYRCNIHRVARLLLRRV